MNKKLHKILIDKCKDMGLTEKAIEDLAESGSEGLNDDSSDEDITAKVNSIVPFAKAIQAEITRKAQNKQTKTNESNAGSEGKGGQSGNDDEPEWFKARMKKYEERMKTLEDENTTLKSEKSKEQRGAEIAAEVKRLGIPDWRMKGVSIPDDADFKTVLTEIKQDLVTQKLMPDDAGGEKSTGKEALKESAIDLLSEIEVKQ